MSRCFFNAWMMVQHCLIERSSQQSTLHTISSRFLGYYLFDCVCWCDCMRAFSWCVSNIFIHIRTHMHWHAQNNKKKMCSYHTLMDTPITTYDSKLKVTNHHSLHCTRQWRLDCCESFFLLANSILIECLRRAISVCNNNNVKIKHIFRTILHRTQHQLL